MAGAQARVCGRGHSIRQQPMGEEEGAEGEGGPRCPRRPTASPPHGAAGTEGAGLPGGRPLTAGCRGRLSPGSAWRSALSARSAVRRSRWCTVPAVRRPLSRLVVRAHPAPPQAVGALLVTLVTRAPSAPGTGPTLPLPAPSALFTAAVVLYQILLNTRSDFRARRSGTGPGCTDSASDQQDLI